MMNDALDISVVICTYTEARWNYLVEAVESVQHQSVLPKETIVAVDHNPALAARAGARLPGVVVVENDGPKGLSGARNSGIAAARGAVIAFLDDDAVASPTWLEQLRASYDTLDVVGVGGAIELQWLSGRPRWFPEEFHWVVGGTYRGMPRTKTPVRNLIGCNMSFRREVLEAIGGFRSGIGRVGAQPVGCEETELCIRVRQRWLRSLIFYEPHAYVSHRQPRSRTRLVYFCSRCYSEGLSKALVSQSVGVRDGLSSERTYVLRTLPRGIVRGVVDTILRGDPFGLARSAVIVMGLTITTVGYLVGQLSHWGQKWSVKA